MSRPIWNIFYVMLHKRRQGANLSTEHVLLVILDTEDGTAVRILLGRMNVSPEVLEEVMFELREWQAD